MLAPAAARSRCARVRTVEIRYDKIQETDRYFGSVQSRYEVDQAFRVGGKVVSRKVEVGQKLRQGDIIAVLDDSDYKLAVQAAQQQVTAAEAQARQAESDRKRLNALKGMARSVRPTTRKRRATRKRPAPPRKRKRASWSSHAIVSNTPSCGHRRTAWSRA